MDEDDQDVYSEEGDEERGKEQKKEIRRQVKARVAKMGRRLASQSTEDRDEWWKKEKRELEQFIHEQLDGMSRDIDYQMDDVYAEIPDDDKVKEIVDGRKSSWKRDLEDFAVGFTFRAIEHAKEDWKQEMLHDVEVSVKSMVDKEMAGYWQDEIVQNIAEEVEMQLKRRSPDETIDVDMPEEVAVQSGAVWTKSEEEFREEILEKMRDEIMSEVWDTMEEAATDAVKAETEEWKGDFGKLSARVEKLEIGNVEAIPSSEEVMRGGLEPADRAAEQVDATVAEVKKQVTPSTVAASPTKKALDVRPITDVPDQTRGTLISDSQAAKKRQSDAKDPQDSVDDSDACECGCCLRERAKGEQAVITSGTPHVDVKPCINALALSDKQSRSSKEKKEAAHKGSAATSSNPVKANNGVKSQSQPINTDKEDCAQSYQDRGNDVAKDDNDNGLQENDEDADDDDDGEDNGEEEEEDDDDEEEDDENISDDGEEMVEEDTDDEEIDDEEMDDEEIGDNEDDMDSEVDEDRMDGDGEATDDEDESMNDGENDEDSIGESLPATPPPPASTRSFQPLVTEAANVTAEPSVARTAVKTSNQAPSRLPIVGKIGGPHLPIRIGDSLRASLPQMKMSATTQTPVSTSSNHQHVKADHIASSPCPSSIFCFASHRIRQVTGEPAKWTAEEFLRL